MNCHYSLAGLAEHRCPECGRAFDPGDPTTFDSRGPRWLPRLRTLLMLFGIIYFMLFMGISLQLRPMYDRNSDVIAQLALTAAFSLVPAIAGWLVLLIGAICVTRWKTR